MSKNEPSARQLAAQILHSVVFQGGFANQLLHQSLEACGLDERDKGFCTELVYGTLRWLSPIQISVKRACNTSKSIDKRILPHLWVATYQLQHLTDTIPAHAAVNEAVSAIGRRIPWQKGFANAVLRKVGSPLHLMLAADDNDPRNLGDAYGLPLELVKVLKSAEACEACNSRPELWIRNMASTMPEMCSKPHVWLPEAYAVDKPGAVEKLPGFKDGQFIVQDPASQIAGLLLGAKPGMRILDMCAAPGTKTMTLAKAVGPSGAIVATDISADKLEKIQENAKRLGVAVETIVADARTLASKQLGLFDAVLLDAPCSNLGTLRRHPEAKFRFSPEHLKEVTALQAELLEAAAGMVKAGGALIYSVCSPLPAEGQDLIRNFLEKHPEFKKEDPRTTLPYLPDYTVKDDAVHLLPHRDNADAFFAVRLVLQRH